MNLQSKYSDLMLNLLVALAISLVVNFSYVLLLIVEQKGEGQPRPARASVVTRSEEGVLHVSPDGHGYHLQNWKSDKISHKKPEPTVQKT